MDLELWLCLKKEVYVNKKEYRLSQICSIDGVSDTSKIQNVKLNFSGQVKKVTAFEVAKILKELYPGYTINNIGPTECSVILQNSAQNKFVLTLKIVFLCIIMFFGGAITIMTFHEDTNMRKVHTGIYEFFTGEYKQTAPIVSIPYSVGVALGFFMLYGIFGKKKSTPSILDLDIHDNQDKLKKYLSDDNKDG